jgi:hypothetical protein
MRGRELAAPTYVTMFEGERAWTATPRCLRQVFMSYLTSLLVKAAVSQPSCPPPPSYIESMTER